MAGPLDGIRVVELGTLIAAPFAGRLFAELGAEVIKVESPDGGDPLRNWRKIHNGTSLWWYIQARNKKSIAVDLKSAAGQSVVRQLAATADVVIENFKPGTLERWGLGWDELHALNPKLTMVRISGFGQDGPYRDRPGFGAIGEAMGGVRYTTGMPDGPPVRTGISLGDSLASLHAALGALASLLRVKSGRGQGQVVDVSLAESVFNLMETLVPEFDLLGHVRTRSGPTLPGIAPSNTYRTQDGVYIVIAGNSDSIFKRMMIAIGRQDLADDARFSTNSGRVEHCEFLDAAIGEWVARHLASEALQRLEAAEVPSGRIYTAADIVSDPHYLARGMILDSRLPDGTPVKIPGIVPKFSDTPGAVRWLGPKLGEHTRDVLQALGVSPAEIDRLTAIGAIG